MLKIQGRVLRQVDKNNGKPTYGREDGNNYRQMVF